MTVPAIVFGFFVSTLYGAFFHLWKDGGVFRLLLYLSLSWVGFISGHIIAAQADIAFIDVGPLHFGLGTVGSLLLLGLGYWLSLVRRESRA